MFRKFGIILLLTSLLLFNLPLTTVQSDHDPSVSDSDQDGNADFFPNGQEADPAPNDPDIGGVYPGAVITYNVFLASDLDANGQSGTILNIVADNVTFDGGGHKILNTQNATQVINVDRSSGVVVKNVDLSRLENVGGDQRGVNLYYCSNSTVTNVITSGIRYGISAAGSNFTRAPERHVRKCVDEWLNAEGVRCGVPPQRKPEKERCHGRKPVGLHYYR